MTRARFILRFDDICPTMDWAVWAEVEAHLIRHGLRPLLAVVPDNRDPGLQVAAPAGDFWDRVRGWQDRGWAIGLHGYQHRYVTQEAGLVAVRKKSEFAGLPRADQRDKLQRGIDIFRREGIRSGVWIAPGDTFDAVTVALLPEFDLRVISAGYCRWPFVDAGRMTWVPQQLYHFRPAPPGVWTVCYHPNQWTAALAQEFHEDVDHFREHIGTMEEVAGDAARRGGRWSEWLCTRPRLSRFLMRSELKLWGWWRSGCAGLRRRAGGQDRLVPTLR